MQSDPTDTRARFLLAALFARTGELLQAIGQMDQVLALEPRNLAALEMRGRLYLAQGTYSKAKQDFTRLINQAPRAAAGYYRMGMLAQAQKQNEEAKHYYEEALKRNPANIDALMRIAFLDIAQNKPDQAIKRVQDQMAKVERKDLLYNLLGDLYMIQGKAKEAAPQFDKALDLNPRLVSALMGLAASARSQNELAKSEQYLTKALQITPNNSTALVARGDVYELMGNTTAAREDYRKSLAINRDFVPALNNLSYLLAQEGGDKNLNEALPLIQRAKRLAPGDPRVLDTMGWVLSRRGAHSSALAEFDEAKKLTPNNPTIYYHLGATYVAMNKLDEAKQNLKKALSLGEFREKAAAERLLKLVEGKS